MNAILTKEEWETMPGGLFDQVDDKFLKSSKYWALCLRKTSATLYVT